MADASRRARDKPNLYGGEIDAEELEKRELASALEKVAKQIKQEEWQQQHEERQQQEEWVFCEGEISNFYGQSRKKMLLHKELCGQAV
jgi:hypothetical protein